jgi:hypothetical protein
MSVLQPVLLMDIQAHINFSGVEQIVSTPSVQIRGFTTLPSQFCCPAAGAAAVVPCSSRPEFDRHIGIWILSSSKVGPASLATGSATVVSCFSRPQSQSQEREICSPFDFSLLYEVCRKCIPLPTIAHQKAVDWLLFSLTWAYLLPTSPQFREAALIFTRAVTAMPLLPHLAIPNSSL